MPYLFNALKFDWVIQQTFRKGKTKSSKFLALFFEHLGYFFRLISGIIFISACASNNLLIKNMPARENTLNGNQPLAVLYLSFCDNPFCNNHNFLTNDLNIHNWQKSSLIFMHMSSYDDVIIMIFLKTAKWC